MAITPGFSDKPTQVWLIHPHGPNVAIGQVIQVPKHQIAYVPGAPFEVLEARAVALVRDVAGLQFVHEADKKRLMPDLEPPVKTPETASSAVSSTEIVKEESLLAPVEHVDLEEEEAEEQHTPAVEPHEEA